MTEPQLPAPLVPPEVDLRDFQFLPLDVVRLRDSDLMAEPDGEVFRANVLSWCVAWHQVPAGSLPDDDATLARLLGFGRDLKGWLKIRKVGGLRGWVKCSDGRLYHPVVAEKACNAWDAKQAQRHRTEAARQARLQRTLQSLSQNENQRHTDSVTDSKGREGKGSKGKGKDKQLAPSPEPARDPSELVEAACRAAGLNPGLAVNHLKLGQEWRKTGLTDEEIMAEIERIAPGKTISSPAYFTNALKDLAAKRKADPPPDPALIEASRERYIALWRRGGIPWDPQFGPEPARAA